jgi:lactoylglutathione lyase
MSCVYTLTETTPIADLRKERCNGAWCILTQPRRQEPGGIESVLRETRISGLWRRAAQGWLILHNGGCVIGLFEGMFERNMLTFNPGWREKAEPLEDFTDVRELQKQLKAKGVAFKAEADETSTGPASFMIMDPDGNPVLVDQHR